MDDQTMDDQSRCYLEKKLDELEAEHGFKIVWAAERSSRVWGTAHADSDFDVKIIFAYPAERYVSILPRVEKMKRVYGPRAKSVDLQGPFDMEVSGWDIRLASQFILKNDPNLLETLTSPIVYRSSGAIVQFSKDAGTFYSPLLLANHYRSWASSHIHMIAKQKKNKSDTEDKKLKQAAYVVRGALSAEWLLHLRKPQTLGAVGMPLSINALLDGSALSENMLSHWRNVVNMVKGGMRAIPEDWDQEAFSQRLRDLLSHAMKGNSEEFVANWTNGALVNGKNGEVNKEIGVGAEPGDDAPNGKPMPTPPNGKPMATPLTPRSERKRVKELTQAENRKMRNINLPKLDAMVKEVVMELDGM